MIKCAEIGYGKSREIVKMLAGMIAAKRGKPFKGGLPSRQWFSSFLKRHPNLSIRKTQAFGQARTAVTQESIDAFYDEYLKVISHILPNYFEVLLREFQDKGKNQK